MDKQKQIEEMEKDLYGIQTYSYMEIYPCRQEQSNEIVAEHLVEKGWIKPAENAVVLETSVYESLEIKNYRDVIYERARKETAEKFAEMADKRIAQCQGKRDGYEAFTIDDKAKYDGDIISLALLEILNKIKEVK